MSSTPTAFNADQFAALARASREVAEVGRELSILVLKTMLTFDPRLPERVNREGVVTGLAARYYVRAGMDPEVSSEEALSALVGALLTAPDTLDGAEARHYFLDASSRARLAAAALAGYVEHRPEPWSHPEVPPTPLVWHRLVGGVRVYLSGTEV